MKEQAQSTVTLFGVDCENLSAENSEMKGKFLSFWVGGQLFAVPIADVVQIVGVQTIAPVPGFPDYGKGIINLRGNIIPVIDVSLRLHNRETACHERTCIIVTNIRRALIGFIVDAVDEVAKIESENISPVPQMTKDTEAKFLTGIAKRNGKVILLLKPEKIVMDEETVEIFETAAKEY